MSASLVGSEMCIRDSSPLPKSEVPGRPLVLMGTSEPRPSFRARAAGEEPVSYTHLTLPTICSV
eukprot:10357874-Alexandrium_andersonii.AAC.1